MDINTVREIVTVVSFLIFLGILLWAFDARTAQSFRDAAELPFLDDDEERAR